MIRGRLKGALEKQTSFTDHYVGLGSKEYQDKMLGLLIDLPSSSGVAVSWHLWLDLGASAGHLAWPHLPSQSSELSAERLKHGHILTGTLSCQRYLIHVFSSDDWPLGNLFDDLRINPVLWVEGGDRFVEVVDRHVQLGLLFLFLRHLKNLVDVCNIVVTLLL